MKCGPDSSPRVTDKGVRNLGYWAIFASKRWGDGYVSQKASIKRKAMPELLFCRWKIIVRLVLAQGAGVSWRTRLILVVLITAPMWVFVYAVGDAVSEVIYNKQRDKGLLQEGPAQKEQARKLPLVMCTSIPHEASGVSQFLRLSMFLIIITTHVRILNEVSDTKINCDFF